MAEQKSLPETTLENAKIFKTFCFKSFVAKAGKGENRILERLSESTDIKEFSDMLKVSYKGRPHLSAPLHLVTLCYKLPHMPCVTQKQKKDKPERGLLLKLTLDVRTCL